MHKMEMPLRGLWRTGHAQGTSRRHVRACAALRAHACLEGGPITKNQTMLAGHLGGWLGGLLPVALLPAFHRPCFGPRVLMPVSNQIGHKETNDTSSPAWRLAG